MNPEQLPRYKRSSGLTIVEVVVTIVILAIALVSVASIVRLGTQSGADVMLQTRSIALGQAYLDEIMGRRFDERSAASGLDPCFGLVSLDDPDPARPCTELASFGPDGIEDSTPCEREAFDDVDDYHGLLEGDGETCPIRDAEGDVRSEYDNFNVAVDVRYSGDEAEWDWPGPAPVPHPTHAKLITVTIKVRGQDEGWMFSAYKGNY